MDKLSCLSSCASPVWEGRHCLVPRPLYPAPHPFSQTDLPHAQASDPPPPPPPTPPLALHCHAMHNTFLTAPGHRDCFATRAHTLKSIDSQPPAVVKTLHGIASHPCPFIACCKTLFH